MFSPDTQCQPLSSFPECWAQGHRNPPGVRLSAVELAVLVGVSAVGRFAGPCPTRLSLLDSASGALHAAAQK